MQSDRDTIELAVPPDFGLPQAVPAGTVLVTGAGGQLGMDVMRVAAAAGIAAVGLDREALDITDAADVQRVMEVCSPNAVIHCAAWTAVDDAEERESDASRVNGEGTHNVARAAEACGARLVAVSTDYVFSGSAVDGYREDDETDPINAYGRSKLAAERATAEHPNAVIARTAWLFGEHGPNFVRTIARLATERPSIDVVTDQVGSPTWTMHLARALLECAAGSMTGVVHLAGTPVATWHDVASEVVHQMGIACEVRPTTSEAFPRPAARPACSILQVTRAETPAVGDWREGVSAVLASYAATGSSRA